MQAAPIMHHGSWVCAVDIILVYSVTLILEAILVFVSGL